MCLQVMIEPFEKWYIFIRPIAPTYLNKRYILCCIDFVNKWVEARVAPFATENSFIDYLFNEIFTRFGVLREIVTDRETNFTSNMVKGIID